MSYVLLDLVSDSDDSDTSDAEPDCVLGDEKKATDNSDNINDGSGSGSDRCNNTDDGNDETAVNGRNDSQAADDAYLRTRDGGSAASTQHHDDEQQNGWQDETLEASKVFDVLEHVQGMPTLRESTDAIGYGGRVLHIPLQPQEEMALPMSVAVPSAASNHLFAMEQHSSSLLLPPTDLLNAAHTHQPLPPMQSAKRPRIQAASASASATETDTAQQSSHSVWFATRIRFFDGPVYQASRPDPSSRECTVVAITRYSPTKMLTAGRAYIVPRTFLPTSCMPMADSQGFMPIVMLSTRDIRADNARSQPWFNILAYTGIINLDCEELNHMQPPAPYLADLSAYPVYTQNTDPYAVSEVVVHLILIDHLTDV